jgi:hypothetical protein
MKVKKVEDLKVYPEADILVDYIIDRWKRGLYSLVLISGLPGTGKSSVCIRLKEKLHERLGGEAVVEDITDNLLDFVRFVRNADPTKKTPDVGVCEEVSVLFPSRRAMSGDNVDLARILDTCRKKKVILFANAPIWPSIDSHMRSMANVYIQTIKVYKGAQLVYCKCYKLQTDPKTGKTYTHSFKRGIKDVNRCYVLKPTLKLWDQYELKKDKFLDGIYEKIEARQVKKMKQDEKLVSHLGGNGTRGMTPTEIKVFDAVRVKGMSVKDASEFLRKPEKTIYSHLRNINLKHIGFENKSKSLTE